MSAPAIADCEISTVRELIDRMAKTRPEAVFIVSPESGRELTFRGLREQAVVLAAKLREAGLEHGDKVAFLLDNGLFTAQLFLGTMYGGFVAVPLNVRAGPVQLSYTLDHCDAKLVFVADEYRALIKELMTKVRRPIEVVPADVDSFVGSCQADSLEDSSPAPAPEDVALLMYTSGSTGQPKGAVHCHRSILAGARNSICSHRFSSHDRALLVLPLYHINAECVTLIPALLSGGSVVIPHRFCVSHFWDWLDEYRCTWSALVPTIVSQLLDWEDPRANDRKELFRRIRFLRSSSAPLSPSLHRAFLEKFPLLLIQAMGSTEAGNIFSNPLPPGENKIGSPGLPWGFEVRIVNRDGAEVRANEPGEVLVRGPSLMQGYYKEPDATTAALDSAGWLYTGDLAYRDDDGYFFVVGRSKELIIKGGVNIAPRQIDEILEFHPSVLEAAVVGVPDRYLGEDLVAFVVLRAGITGDERELLGYCESRLGHFKTPSRIHFISDLPKGPSGKVQRLRLLEAAARPKLDATHTSSHAECTAADRISPVAHGNDRLPSLSIEQTIAAAWAELLDERPVNWESNFFALGGDSLLAIQCLSRLRAKLPITLSLSDFFEHATVSQQAALVRQRLWLERCTGGRSSFALLQRQAPPPELQAIPLRDPALPCPLSPAQQRVWFVDQLNPGLLVFNEAEAVRLRGKLDVDALEQALNAIIVRHEMLRTTIEVIHEIPTAVIHESWPLRLKRIDLSAMSSAERQMKVEQLLIDEPRRPYRLEVEPGIRATLLRLGPGEHIFILMMHHIICDWSSEGILWREMSAIYPAISRGEPFALPPLPIQHGDYAVWQQRQVAETSFADDLAFWEEELRDAPKLLGLPADRPRPPSVSHRGARQRFRLNPILVKNLRRLSRAEQASLFTVFAAAFNVLLFRYTGQEDILVGIPLADRDRPELRSVIGFLLHTHVLRTDLSGDITFHELLARVQQSAGAIRALRCAVRPGGEQSPAGAQPELLPTVSGDAQLARSRSTTVVHRARRINDRVALG